MDYARIIEIVDSDDFTLDHAINQWISASLGALNEVQELTIPRIMKSQHSLVMAPTGSGKTLAAFLGIISTLISYEKQNSLQGEIYAIYISPLKALNNDIHRNLDVPLSAIKKTTGTHIKTAIRTGDTPTKERSRMLRSPPHILITTPESLALMLTAPKFKEKLRSTKWVIIDEIHALADNKRGTLLSLCIERLEYFSNNSFTRIGLSATVEPPGLVAQFLMGNRREDIGLVNLGTLRELNLRVISPTKNLVHAPMTKILKRHQEIIYQEIKQHNTTLIFANTRHWSERLAVKIGTDYPELVEKIAVHHGSLDKEIRLSVEDHLKLGELKGVFTSTSLELGIDIGSIDSTLQLGSPKTVRSFTQRVGRSGHAQELQSKGSIIVYDRDDLVESLAIAKLTKEGKIDRLRIPEAPLDVLFQMIVSLAVEQRWGITEVFEIVSKSYPYRNLSLDNFREIIREQANTTGSKDSWKHTLIWYDEDIDEFGKRRRSRQAFMQNVGTIPDVAMVEVLLETYRTRIGKVADRFAENLQDNDVFVLGGRSYQFVRSAGSKIIVREVVGAVPTVPNWTGEPRTRTFEISEEVSRLYEGVDEYLEVAQQDQAIRWICEKYQCGRVEAQSVVNYIIEQKAVGLLPTRRRIVIEEYIDPSGGKSILVLSIFGREVNLVIAKLLGIKLSEALQTNITTSATDNGLLLRVPMGIDIDPTTIFEELNLDELFGKLYDNLQNSEIYKNRFRQVAGRALMILKRIGSRKNSIETQIKLSRWFQKKLPANYAIVRETKREILEDTYNTRSARMILQEVLDGFIGTEYVDSGSIPSPMTHSILLNDNTEIILMSDKKALLLNLHQQVLSQILPEMVDGKPVFDASRVSQIFAQRLEVSSTGSAEVSITRFYELPQKFDSHIQKCSELTGIDEPTIEKLLQSSTEIFPWEGRYKSRTTIPYLAALSSIEIWTKYDNRYDEMRSRSREISPDFAIEQLILILLRYYGPVTENQLRSILKTTSEGIKSVLEKMVRKHSLLVGRFTEPVLQYIRYEDRELLLTTQPSRIDHDQLMRYRMQRMRLYDDLQSPHMSIPDYLRENGPVRDTIEFVSRLPGFSWQALRNHLADENLYFGRFLGRRLVFIDHSSIDYFILLSRDFNQDLIGRDVEILDLITLQPGMTIREIRKYLNYTNAEIQSILNLLERECYISRVGWDLSLTQGVFSNPQYVPLPIVTFSEKKYKNAVNWLIRQCIHWYGPLSLQDFLRITRLPYSILEEQIQNSKIYQIKIYNHTYYTNEKQLGELQQPIEENHDIHLLSPLDPYFYMVTGSLRWDSIPRQARLMVVSGGKTVARIEITLPDSDVLQVLNIQIAKKFIHDDQLLRKLAALLIRMALKAFQARLVIIEDINFKTPLALENRLFVQSFKNENYSISSDVLVGGTKNFFEFSILDILQTRIVSYLDQRKRRFDSIEDLINHIDTIKVIDAPNLLSCTENTARLLLNRAIREGKLHHKSGILYHPAFWIEDPNKMTALNGIFELKQVLTQSEINALSDLDPKQVWIALSNGVKEGIIESISPYSQVQEYRLFKPSNFTRAEKIRRKVVTFIRKFGPISFSPIYEGVSESQDVSRLEVLLALVDAGDKHEVSSLAISLNGTNLLLYFDSNQKAILEDRNRFFQIPHWLILEITSIVTNLPADDASHLIIYKGLPFATLKMNKKSDEAIIEEFNFVDSDQEPGEQIIELAGEIEKYFFLQGFQLLSYRKVQMVFPDFWMEVDL